MRRCSLYISLISFVSNKYIASLPKLCHYGKTMKNLTLITLVFLFLTTHALAQETGIYQRDSIYKVNKVKARLWFSGPDKELIVTTYYNEEGKLVRYEPEPGEDGMQVTTYYFYDSKGHATGMVDTIRSEESKKPIAISNYELQYDSDVLIKLTKYNPDGSIDYIKKFTDQRNIENFFRYKNGAIVESSTTEYRTKLHEERFFGWEIRNGKKSVWDYRFKYELENGRVKRYVKFEGRRKHETVKFFYNEKGLLIKMDNSGSDFFEYVYY